MDTIKIEWDLLGAKLATLSDEEQGKFFKGFAFELSNLNRTTKDSCKHLQSVIS